MIVLRPKERISITVIVMELEQRPKCSYVSVRMRKAELVKKTTIIIGVRGE